MLSATTTDLAEFSTSLKENRDFAHFKLSSDLDQELTFVRKKMTEEDVVVSGIFNGRETSSQSGPEQWSPVVCTTVRDLVRRHKVLVSAGIPPQTATELAATWSMSAGVCMAIAKRAFRQISDKKDFEGENVEFMQRLFYSAGSIRDSLEFVYDSMESVYMRSLAEGMALEIIATQMDAMDLGDQNKSKLFTDELRTRSLGYMQRKYELTSDYVDLEEVAAVTSFSRQEIMRFFGA